MGLVDHLEKLHAFKIIAETGKLREAALRLHLTQPSLTRLIQTLEESLGQQLFYRSRQGMVLTAAGHLLLTFTESTLKNLEDLEEKLKYPTDDLAGLLKIGSYESLADYFWPDFIASMRKTNPELKLAITTHGAERFQKSLDENLLDLIVDSEPRLFGDFTSWVLYQDRFNFYGKKKDFPIDISTEVARNLTLVYCPKAFDSSNKGILHHLEENGFFFRDKIELDSFTSVATFAKKGLGVAVLPQKLAATYLDSKQLSLISLEKFSNKGFGSHNICATVRSSSGNDQRIYFVIKMLKGWFKA